MTITFQSRAARNAKVKASIGASFRPGGRAARKQAMLAKVRLASSTMKG